MPDTAARYVIWAPIVHEQADHGTLGSLVKDAYTRRHGKAKWDHHLKTIEAVWSKLRADLAALDLPWDRVRLYQDGLPAAGPDLQIVRDLAAAGSRNHQLLLELSEKGARITGTESPDLLLEEYRLARESLAAGAGPTVAARVARGKAEARRILDARDVFIAARIAATLKAGEIGLLFLGALHSLAGRFPPGVELITLADARHRDWK
jgi:hypothetical protein